MDEVLFDAPKLNEWKPTPKQAEFLALPYEILEGFYAGAVNAGKTHVLLAYPLVHKFYERSNFKGLFLRRTFPELKNEVIPRSRQFFEPLGATYNKQDKCWTFPSGALFFFGHCEDEEDVHNYDSMQPNYVAFDELTSFTEWQYLYITLQRVRAAVGSGLPAIVRSASNPGNIGHNWVRARFIDPCPEGFKVIQNKAGVKRIFIPATVKDNPYVSQQYLNQLESLPEAEKQAKLYGRWDAYEGSVFDEFRDKTYPDEPENALHVIEPFNIPLFWPKIYSIDWGYTPPAINYIACGAVTPDERLILYMEKGWQKTQIVNWTAEVKEWADVENPRTIKLCKSASQKRGQEHTVQSEVEKGLNRAVDLTDNNPGTRISSKMLMHEYFRWKPKYVPSFMQKDYNDEHAMWLLRNRGVEEYQSYLDSFRPYKEETNLPKFLCFNTCKLFINSIKSCVYDQTHTQDVAEFNGDDPYDAGRYLIDAADRYFNEAINEKKKLDDRNKLDEALRKTGDMTAFYRESKKLDNTVNMRPIRRFHRGMR